MTKKRCTQRGYYLCAIVLLLPAFVSAQLISDLHYNLFGGDAFYVPDEFSLYEDFTWDSAKPTGTFRLAGDDKYNYEIRGGSVQSTPSTLMSDQSYPGIPGLNDYVAKGYFASGATLTLIGSIWHVVDDEFGNPLIEDEIFASGALLTATVNNNFYVKEEDFLPNELFLQLDMTILGGELATGTVTGMQLEPHAIADITLKFCSQYDNPGLRVDDFTGDDISYLSPSIIQMYSAPEPLTAVLLGFGSLLAIRRKR